MRILFQVLSAATVIFAVVFPAHAGITDIGAAQDARVAEGHPTANYGTQTGLLVASATGNRKNERAWLLFDLSGHLPPGAVITSASLRLYCYRSDRDDDLLAAVHGSQNDQWNETAITWNTQPAFGDELHRIAMTVDDEDRWLEWDVTAFVQSKWTGDTARKVSLMVKAVPEGLDPWRACSFDAKEFSGSLSPRLRIAYSGDWPIGKGFTIFHFNDAHARLLPHDFDVPEINDVAVFEKIGGAAAFAANLLALKTAVPDSLVLDAGDLSEGSPLGDLRKGGGMIDFYNLLDRKLKALGGRGIDAVVVGNHDVRTLEMIHHLKQDTTFPVISMNVCRHGTRTPYFSPYTIVTINGVKIGILGLTNDESSPGPDAGKVIDIIQCVWEDHDDATLDIKEWVRELREKKKCHVVVLLAHSGHRRLVAGEMNGSKPALIADVGGVRPPEVVIAGHWHTWTETAWMPAHLNGKTLFSEAAAYLQYIGELKLSGYGKYIRASQHPIRNALIPPDKDALQLLDRLTKEYMAKNPAHPLDEVIGYSAVDLSLDKGKWWSVSEYPWSATHAAGAWICDAMQWKATALGYAADLALQSGGGIRRDVPAGPVTYAQIYETYPWGDDHMVRIPMTGRQIRRFLQDKHCGASISKEWVIRAEGGDILSITYRGKPLRPAATYQVVISQYMLSHEMGAYSAKAKPEYLQASIREAVVDFTSRFTKENPLTLPGPRYLLNTQFAGGFRAVVTMTVDQEREPYLEAAFIRLLRATPDTLQRRDRAGLVDLVNSDGTVNPGHRFSEIMLVRGHLGFTDGRLRPGDIIEVRGEGGFYAGNPQFVDQEGIAETHTDIPICGHDEGLARPEYHAVINTFHDNWHENHYVRFYAEKTGKSTIRDGAGTRISVYRPGGFSPLRLPGRPGDLLELTGVQTRSETERRFRCSRAIPVARAQAYKKAGSSPWLRDP